MTDDFKSKLKVLRELAKDDNLWSVITCLRGPDFPSERPNMSEAEHKKAYKARRDRKFDTVEIIRAASVGQVGGARVHVDDHVTLPPKDQWDHFDKHVARAAAALGLKVKLRKPKGTLPVAIEPIKPFNATSLTGQQPPAVKHTTGPAPYASNKYNLVKHKQVETKAYLTFSPVVLEWVKDPKLMPQWVHVWKYAILYVDSMQPDKAVLFSYNKTTQSLQYTTTMTGVLEESWVGASFVSNDVLAYQKELVLNLKDANEAAH